MEEKALIDKYSKYIPGMSVLFPIENWHHLVTRDGVALHTYKYPANQVKCVLLTLHGLNSYSQPTGVIAKVLAENGCEVLAFDFRGHGKSSGVRGYIENVDLLVQDTIDFVQEISSLYSGIPLFIMGGSIGAAVAVNVAIAMPEKFCGVILINPALGLNSRFESAIRGISNCLASCCPTFAVYKADAYRSTKNEHLHKYMRENIYYYQGKTRIGTSAAILNAMKSLRKKYKSLQNKLLVIQGSDDQVTNLKKVQSFMKKVETLDKTLLMYPGRPHSIVFEDAVFDIAGKIKDWVVERVNI